MTPVISVVGRETRISTRARVTGLTGISTRSRIAGLLSRVTGLLPRVAGLLPRVAGRLGIAGRVDVPAGAWVTGGGAAHLTCRATVEEQKRKHESGQHAPMIVGRSDVHQQRPVDISRALA